MYRRILVPIDGSPVSERALDEASQFARQLQAHIEIVMVAEEVFYYYDDSGLDYAALLEPVKRNAEKILSDAKTKLQQSGVTAETKLLEAKGKRIAHAIVAEAENALIDLIIIGTHGRSGFSRILLGSVAEAVLRTAHIPVLLIRGS